MDGSKTGLSPRRPGFESQLNVKIDLFLASHASNVIELTYLTYLFDFFYPKPQPNQVVLCLNLTYVGPFINNSPEVIICEMLNVFKQALFCTFKTDTRRVNKALVVEPYEGTG